MVLAVALEDLVVFMEFIIGQYSKEVSMLLNFLVGEEHVWHNHSLGYMSI